MKRTIGILDLIIFLLSIIVLLIAFFMNMDKLSLLIGIGLIILLGIAHTRLEKIAGLSSENPKIKTMRRTNRLSMVFVVILYLIPLAKKDLIGNVPYQFFLLITIMIFSGNIAPNQYGFVRKKKIIYCWCFIGSYRIIYRLFVLVSNCK